MQNWDASRYAKVDSSFIPVASFWELDRNLSKGTESGNTCSRSGGARKS